MLGLIKLKASAKQSKKIEKEEISQTTGEQQKKWTEGGGEDETKKKKEEDEGGNLYDALGSFSRPVAWRLPAVMGWVLCLFNLER